MKSMREQSSTFCNSILGFSCCAIFKFYIAATLAATASWVVVLCNPTSREKESENLLEKNL
jgi:hypothetical protein